MGLKIEISSNLNIVNFLDVTLNLNNNSYKQFSMSNIIPKYINVNSSRPAESNVKQIFGAINIRINSLSSSKNIFNNKKNSYNEALYNCSYKDELEYLYCQEKLHKKRP